MRPARTLLATAALAALLAGCGSSSSSGSATGPVVSAASTATSSLKAATTPQYTSPATTAPVRSGLVKVAYRNIAIDPEAIRVKVGSSIEWTNYDSVEHNVTSEGGPQKFASKDFGEGGTYEIRALKAGVIHYQCTIHPASMNGTIEVVK